MDKAGILQSGAPLDEILQLTSPWHRLSMSHLHMTEAKGDRAEGTSSKANPRHPHAETTSCAISITAVNLTLMY